ncbi:MAG: DUF6788 family protein [Candidatus Odinarchaeia archaeon]
MDEINEIKNILEILQTKEGVLAGTLSKLKQKTRLKNSKQERYRSYWYLTWKEGGRSKAIYIPAKDVSWVTKGIENMRKVKEYLSQLAMVNLRRLKEGRDVRKRG